MNNSLVLARSEEQVIGLNGAIPWYVPNDLLRFRAITSAHDYMVMGMKTFESLPHVLEGRHHIVVTRDPAKARDKYAALADQFLPGRGNAVVNFLDWDKTRLMLFSSHSCAVIGGAEIARLALPYISNIYLTTVRGVKLETDDTDEVTVFDYNPHLDFELMEYVDDIEAVYERFRRRRK